jgi:hypothetical protein
MQLKTNAALPPQEAIEILRKDYTPTTSWTPGRCPGQWVNGKWVPSHKFGVPVNPGRRESTITMRFVFAIITPPSPLLQFGAPSLFTNSYKKRLRGAQPYRKTKKESRRGRERYLQSGDSRDRKR